MKCWQNTITLICILYIRYWPSTANLIWWRGMNPNRMSLKTMIQFLKKTLSAILRSLNAPKLFKLCLKNYSKSHVLTPLTKPCIIFYPHHSLSNFKQPFLAHLSLHNITHKHCSFKALAVPFFTTFK